MMNLQFLRRALAQESNAANYYHLQCSEVPKNLENVVTLSCCMHPRATFYNLGIKNQASKLKFGMRDVIIKLSNIYSGFFNILKN